MPCYREEARGVCVDDRGNVNVRGVVNNFVN